VILFFQYLNKFQIANYSELFERTLIKTQKLNPFNPYF